MQHLKNYFIATFLIFCILNSIIIIKLFLNYQFFKKTNFELQQIKAIYNENCTLLENLIKNNYDKKKINIEINKQDKNPTNVFLKSSNEEEKKKL